MLRLAVVLVVPLVRAFLFGGGNQGCCSPCGRCRNKKRRFARSITTSETFSRQTREVAAEDVVKVDAKCNSPELRDIIINNIDRVTSVAKKRIQAAAEDELDARHQFAPIRTIRRFNVICARGDFSYITNTELFCQQTVGDVTCYVFKQLSDVVRSRL